MRLLLASFIDDNRFSGMGKWTHRMAEGLAARGHPVTCWWNNDFPRLRQGGRWAALGFPPVLAARLAAARGTFDVAVVHEPSGLAWAAARRLLPGLPPMVAMCHNVESKVHRVLVDAADAGLAQVPAGGRIKPRLIRTWQSDGAARLADHVACLSNEDAAWLEREVGVLPGRITVMANGVDVARFVPVPREPPAHARVLFVGGWLEVKGRRLMAAAWPKVASHVPGALLTLMGTGRSADEVLSDFPESCRHTIRVLPRVEGEEEVAREFAAHGVFCMPSLSEGSPLSLMEAMASGLPSVVTRVGGIPDVVDDGVEGMVVPPLDVGALASGLERLLSDAALAQQMGRAARLRAERLTWDETAAALERACLAALRDGGRAG